MHYSTHTHTHTLMCIFVFMECVYVRMKIVESPKIIISVIDVARNRISTPLTTNMYVCAYVCVYTIICMYKHVAHFFNGCRFEDSVLFLLAYVSVCVCVCAYATHSPRWSSLNNINNVN